MTLKEQIYSVLIVSSSERFTTALSPLLPPSRYQPVFKAADISTAKRAITEREFDFVIINSPLSDDPGIRFAIDTSSQQEAVVLLMARAELSEEIYYRTAEYGVFVLPKPASKAMIGIALNWLSSARERLRRTRKKTLTLEEKMAEIRIVNRAKWLLISELKLEEAQAHRYIEKQAMDRCVSKKVIAEEIIRTYS